MRKLLIGALLASAFAAPAAAQVNPAFTGPRVEAIVGYDILKSGERDDDGVDTSENEGDESVEGVAYGAAVGYDFAIGGLVAGVEAELSDSTGKQEVDESIDAPFGYTIETGRDIYVGGRLGFLAAPSTLIYGKAGYTSTKIDGRIDDETDGAIDFDQKVDGWRLGAGVEQMLASNSYAKLEYRYSKYGDLEFDDSDAELDIDLDRHQIVAGIGFRF